MPSAFTTPSRDAEALSAQTVGGLAQPGTFFNGAERIALARTARQSTRRAPADPIPEPFYQATRTVAAESGRISRALVDSWALNELDWLSLVELISIVARITGVDSYRFGLGLAPLDLPTRPSTQPPSFEADIDATIGAGWVPTVGPASAATALSALPREAAAAEELKSAFYLPEDQIDYPSFGGTGPLSRPQIELIAARTSQLNHCLYGVIRHSWLLRASAPTDDINLDAVQDPSLETGIDHGTEILAFVDAVVTGDQTRLGQARRDLARLNLPLADPISRVVANFEMTSRILNATGVPIPTRYASVAGQLMIDVPDDRWASTDL